MVLHQFPDLTWLKSQIDMGFANRQGWGGRPLTEKGWPIIVLNTVSKQVSRENIRGPLSLFSNISGTSKVMVDRRTVTIPLDSFFLTNSDQHYSLEIDQNQAATETFNIHFGTHFAEQAITALTHSPEFILDHQFDSSLTPSGFHNRLHRKDEMFNKILMAIRTDENKARIRFEELLYRLISHLLHGQKQLNEIKLAIPVLKSSTREEIIKRLLVSTDYIYTYYPLDLSLNELARISCFSKFHFLRLFKIVFQKTPHQFITEIRVQKAKELLKAGELDVHQVARQVGFDNSSSFSRLFFNQVGIYPTQFQ